MPVGEHYFQTKEQLDYLENWLEKRFEKVYIEQGTINDIAELEALYDDLNDYLSANTNYPGWIKGIYPIRETAEKAIEEGSLYVLRKENVIVGSIVLNHEPEEAYDNVKWGIDTSYNEILVLRTLVVHPRFMKQGIAKQLMDFAKELAVSANIKTIRLDVSVDNTPAIKLYEQSGYTYVETVDLGLPYDHLKWFRLYELVL
ncbi:GNAT family N-acetyltransferase [Proteiniphilum saccharofermentans]|uniref:GNAT family N-acetyltransferase n=1 Tax=Proteiniphilum saccharofermentans TaxID=1642647 RepID=UPI0039191EEA